MRIKNSVIPQINHFSGGKTSIGRSFIIKEAVECNNDVEDMKVEMENDENNIDCEETQSDKNFINDASVVSIASPLSSSEDESLT